MSDRTEVEIPDTGLVPEAPPAEETREKAVNPRDEMMAQIAARYEAQRAKELQQGEVYDQEAKEAGLSFPEDEDGGGEQRPTRDLNYAPDQRATLRQVEQTPRPPTSRQELIPLDLGDGRGPLMVTQQQAIELARMGAVTNRVLHDYQQNPARYQQQFQPPQPQYSQQQRQGVVDEERIRKTVRSLQFATEDDATEALSGLISDVAARQNALQPSLVQQAAELAAREAAARAQAVRDHEIIKQEYPEIFADPLRQHAAAAALEEEYRKVQATGEQVPPLEMFRRAGDRAMAAFGLQNDRPTRRQQSSGNGTYRVARDVDGIEARKRLAPRQTGTVIDRRANLEAPGPRFPSNAEIVERMRQQRGQS